MLIATSFANDVYIKANPDMNGNELLIKIDIPKTKVVEVETPKIAAQGEFGDMAEPLVAETKVAKPIPVIEQNPVDTSKNIQLYQNTINQNKIENQKTFYQKNKYYIWGGVLIGTALVTLILHKNDETSTMSETEKNYEIPDNGRPIIIQSRLNSFNCGGTTICNVNSNIFNNTNETIINQDNLIIGYNATAATGNNYSMFSINGAIENQGTITISGINPQPLAYGGMASTNAYGTITNTGLIQAGKESKYLSFPDSKYIETGRFELYGMKALNTNGAYSNQSVINDGQIIFKVSGSGKSSGTQTKYSNGIIFGTYTDSVNALNNGTIDIISEKNAGKAPNGNIQGSVIGMYGKRSVDNNYTNSIRNTGTIKIKSNDKTGNLYGMVTSNVIGINDGEIIIENGNFAVGMIQEQYDNKYILNNGEITVNNTSTSLGFTPSIGMMARQLAINAGTINVYGDNSIGMYANPTTTTGQDAALYNQKTGVINVYDYGYAFAKSGVGIADFFNAGTINCMMPGISCYQAGGGSINSGEYPGSLEPAPLTVLVTGQDGNVGKINLSGDVELAKLSVSADFSEYSSEKVKTFNGLVSTDGILSGEENVTSNTIIWNAAPEIDNNSLNVTLSKNHYADFAENDMLEVANELENKYKGGKLYNSLNVKSVSEFNSALRQISGQNFATSPTNNKNFNNFNFNTSIIDSSEKTENRAYFVSDKTVITKKNASYISSNHYQSMVTEVRNDNKNLPLQTSLLISNRLEQSKEQGLMNNIYVAYNTEETYRNINFGSGINYVNTNLRLSQSTYNVFQNTLLYKKKNFNNTSILIYGGIETQTYIMQESKEKGDNTYALNLSAQTTNIIFNKFGNIIKFDINENQNLSVFYDILIPIAEYGTKRIATLEGGETFILDTNLNSNIKKFGLNYNYNNSKNHSSFLQVYSEDDSFNIVASTRIMF